MDETSGVREQDDPADQIRPREKGTQQQQQQEPSPVHVCASRSEGMTPSLQSRVTQRGEMLL